MDCKEFVCKLKDSCLYVDQCEVCRISPCMICLLKNTCERYKEERKRKHESSL